MIWFLVIFAFVFSSYAPKKSVHAADLQDSVHSPAPLTVHKVAQQEEPTTARVEIINAAYLPDRDVYELALSIDHPSRIYEVYVAIWDVRGGNNVSGDRIYPNPKASFVAEISTLGLEPEREYSIRVRAIDFSGILVQLPREHENDRPETILAEHRFTYRPPVVEPAEFTIQSVRAPVDATAIEINLSAPAPRAGEQYEGFIVGKETGQLIGDTFGPSPFVGNRIEIPRPTGFAPTTVPQEFVLTLYILTPPRVRPEQGMIRSEAVTYEFTLGAVAPHTFMERLNDSWSRIWAALEDNPIILIAVLFVIFIGTGWLLFPSRSREGKNKKIRPPVDLPSVFKYPDQISLQLQVTQTPGRGDRTERLITHFPCVIGRDNGDINIAGDQQVSGRHAEITRDRNKLYITDLNSRNGTFVNGGQIQAKKPVQLQGTTTVKLGPRTTLVLKIKG